MTLFSVKNASRLALLALVALAGCGPRGKRARDHRIAAAAAGNQLIRFFRTIRRGLNENRLQDTVRFDVVG